MFAVMLANAIGNTGMMSVLPAIGRALVVPDIVIAIAFSLSALLWVVVAPLWARQLGRFGAKNLILVGLAGFAASLLIGAAALAAALSGWISAIYAFGIFIVGRTVYGGFGSAAPPAAQAIVAATSSRGARTRALSLLASAFGLGTILGPALAPFLVLPVLGLAGPPFVFSLFGIAMLFIIAFYSGDYRPPPLQQVALAEPSMQIDLASHQSSPSKSAPGSTLRFTDPKILPWILAGIVSGHSQAFIAQTMAFLIMDRLHLLPLQAQPAIGTVLMTGALATLLGQWGVIPRFDPTPRQLLIWGTVLAIIGCIGIGLAFEMSLLIIAYCVASLGFGLLRPAFAAGASLAVSEDEQAAAAGYVTSASGVAFVLGPFAGILLYQFSQALPAFAAAMVLGLLMPMVISRVENKL